MDKQQAIENITLIRSLMEDARKATLDFGKFYVVWAGVVICAMVVQLTLIEYNLEIYSLISWIIFMGGALIWDIKENRKQNKEKKTKSFAGKIIETIWTASLAMIITTLFLMPPISGWKFIYGTPTIAIIMGIGHFMTGEICRSWILRGSGILWFLSYIPLMLLIDSGNLIGMAWLFAFLMFSLQLVPGLLYGKYISLPSSGNQERAGGPERALGDISYIRRLLNETRGAVAGLEENLIFWSLLVVAAIGVESFLLVEGSGGNITTSWFIFIFAGVAWSVYRHANRKSIDANGSSLVGALFASLLIAILLTVFYEPVMNGGLNLFAYPSIALYLTVVYVILGRLCDYRLFIFTGLGWWVTAIILTVIASDDGTLYSGMAFAVAIILFQLIPGYVYMKQVGRPKQQ
jgi:hypothetical protein